MKKSIFFISTVVIVAMASCGDSQNNNREGNVDDSTLREPYEMPADSVSKDTTDSLIPPTPNPTRTPGL